MIETIKPIMFLLGLCSGYVPDNLQLSDELCFNELAAKSRIVKIENPYDDFDRAYFNWQIKIKI